MERNLGGTRLPGGGAAACYIGIGIDIYDNIGLKLGDAPAPAGLRAASLF